MTEEQIPALIVALSRRVGLSPMKWKEYDDRVVIVFTNGQKMVFDREVLSPMMEQYTPAKKTAAPPAIKPTPAKKNAEQPAIKNKTTPAKKK